MNLGRLISAEAGGVARHRAALDRRPRGAGAHSARAVSTDRFSAHHHRRGERRRARAANARLGDQADRRGDERHPGNLADQVDDRARIGGDRSLLRLENRHRADAATRADARVAARDEAAAGCDVRADRPAHLCGVSDHRLQHHVAGARSGNVAQSRRSHAAAADGADRRRGQRPGAGRPVARVSRAHRPLAAGSARRFAAAGFRRGARIERDQFAGPDRRESSARTGARQRAGDVARRSRRDRRDDRQQRAGARRRRCHRQSRTRAALHDRHCRRAAGGAAECAAATDRQHHRGRGRREGGDGRAANNFRAMSRSSRTTTSRCSSAVRCRRCATPSSSASFCPW